MTHRAPIPDPVAGREAAGSRGGSRLPQHLAEHGGTVNTWRGWYTHEHAHAHPEHVESLNHKPAFSHRHEHQWEPDERHHHPIRSSTDSPYAR